MQAVFDKILIDINNCMVVASIHTWDKQSDRRPCHTHDHSCVARPRMSGQLYMTQVTEATSKTNCQKRIFALCSPLNI